MDRIETKTSRRELYEQVWSVPMWTLARKCGLSDVGLAKICKKNDIPRPPRGYWARKQSGRKLRTPPLPKPELDPQIMIYGQARPGSEITQKTIPLKKIFPREFLKKEIPVPEALGDPHPLVARSMEILVSGKEDRNGLVQSGSKECLDIRVAPDSLPRAFRIWDSFLKALNEYGFQVWVSDGGTKAMVNGVPLGLAMAEQLVRTWREPRDHDLSGYYYQFGYKQHADHPKPSGGLCLSIQGAGGRKNWRDVGPRRLENILRLVILSVLRTVANADSERKRDSGAGDEKT